MPRSSVAVSLLLLLTASPGGPRVLFSRGMPPQAVDDPCAAAVVQSGTSRAFRSATPAIAKDHGYGTDKRSVTDLLVPSALAARTRPLETTPRATASRDIDDIAVIEDDGTLILRPNRYDLGGVGVRFQPTAAGYDLTPGTPRSGRSRGANCRSAMTTRCSRRWPSRFLTTDDDTRSSSSTPTAT
jgi:hypothetical protein